MKQPGSTIAPGPIIALGWTPGWGSMRGWSLAMARATAARGSAARMMVRGGSLSEIEGDEKAAGLRLRGEFRGALVAYEGEIVGAGFFERGYAANFEVATAFEFIRPAKAQVLSPTFSLRYAILGLGRSGGARAEQLPSSL